MSIGIEFNQSGEKEIYKREGYDRLNQRIYNFQEIEIQKLWKLSFPLIAEKPGTSASSKGYVHSYSRSDIALMLKYSLRVPLKTPPDLLL